MITSSNTTGMIMTGPPHPGPAPRELGRDIGTLIVACIIAALIAYRYLAKK